MMHMDTWATPTTLTHAAASLQDSTPGSLPADPIRTRRAALPARMSATGDVRGLPRRHAVNVAEHALGMKVTRGARHRSGAPVTRLCYLIRTTGIRLARLSNDAAIKRTESLGASAAHWSAAHITRARGASSPSVRKVAGTRTETTIRPSVLRVKVVPAILTLANLFAFHGGSIPPIEIEERYCEIAAKRLAQAVLPGMEVA